MKIIFSLLLILSLSHAAVAQNRTYQAMNCNELHGALAVQENLLIELEVNQYAVKAKMQEIKTLSEKYSRNKTLSVGAVVTGTLSSLGSFAIINSLANGASLKTKIIKVTAAVSVMLLGELLAIKGVQEFNANEQQALENKKEEVLLQTWNTVIDTEEAINTSISIAQNEIKLIEATRTIKGCR